MSEHPEALQDHFRKPRHLGSLQGAGVRHGTAGRQPGGPWIALDLRLEGAHIVEVAWRGLGCPHLMAMASMLSEHLVGCTIEAGRELPRSALATAVALPVEKTDRLLLLEDVLVAALDAAEDGSA